MLSVHCPTHGSEVLLSERRIRGLRTTKTGGVEVDWECWCGTTGRLMVGRNRPMA